MRLQLTVLAVLSMLCNAPAHAVMVGDTQVADTLVVDGQTLHLNGAGRRQYPIVGTVYIAALYLPTPSHDAAAILALNAHRAVVIHYLHSASKSQVENSFRKGERVNCGDGQCDPAELPDFEKLVQAAPAVQEGDTSTYIYDGNRLRVLANGRPIADFADGPLSRQLLLGWIGQHPPTERLKQDMLGVASD